MFFHSLNYHALIVFLTSFLILILYCLSAVLIYRNPGTTKPSGRLLQLSPALAASVLHIIFLKQLIYPESGILILGFFSVFCLISWLVCIQILISSLYRPLQSLGILMFPVSGLTPLLTQVTPSPTPIVGASTQFIHGHIMISVIAYSLIMLSALQAIALAYQDRAIRSHHPGGFIKFLPPLHDMETLLFQMLGFGFIFLTTSLISGFIFMQDIFAQHLIHKTVLSIIGWIILAILLFGRFKFGWRGKIAIRWTLTAFIVIMLAYFGSQLVIEFILAR